METIREGKSLRGFGDAGFEFRYCQSIESAAATQILKDGQLAIETRRLENNAEAGPDFGCGRNDIMAGDLRCSGIGK
jgi:hypothetical protein